MSNTQNDAVPAADGEGTRHQEGSRVRASATPTGNTQEPVAWAVMLSSGCTWGLCQDKWEAVAVCDAMKTNLVAHGYILPLYRQPQPTLADEERFVLREVRDIYADEDDVKCNEIAAVIDWLLERTK